MDNVFISLLTGNDHFTPPNAVKEAVRIRAEQIIETFPQQHPKGWDACYDGNRCLPQNLGWRFQQMFGSPEPQEILDGKWDEQIEETYHEAADSEYWYRYEKQWD